MGLQTLPPHGGLPNLFIAGAPKAGTSSLHSWLSDHPDAVGSTPKETYYFVDPGTHMYRAQSHIGGGLDGYRRYFPIALGAQPRVLLESTPNYLYSDTALRHLPELPSEPRFIFVLREPSAQVYSLFTYFQQNWDWIPRELSFADYLAALNRKDMQFKGNEMAAHALEYADYTPYLERWRARVGPERMRVWLFDDLKRDPVAFTRRAAEFVGLEPDFYDDYDYPRDNETYVARSGALQKLNVAVRGLLPQGRAYRVLRDAYRRLNTRRPAAPAQADEHARQQLHAQFAAANARLAQRFSLDLSAWASASEETTHVSDRSREISA